MYFAQNGKVKEIHRVFCPIHAKTRRYTVYFVENRRNRGKHFVFCENLRTAEKYKMYADL